MLLISDITDSRKDKSSLGSSGLAGVFSDDIIKWLENAQQSRGHLIDSVQSGEQPLCTIDVSLKLAYIRSSSTSKATYIVLRVILSKLEKLKYYRGTHTGMNWNSKGS